MKRRNLLITFIFLLLTFSLISCDTTDPGDPSEVRPPGYQEDIPWPSLADTPWPMYRHDPQLTGRSPYIGPSLGQIYKTIPATNIASSMVIGNNSSIIYTSNGSLILADYKGNSEWELNIAVEISSTPLIDSDSTIYVTTGSLNSLVAVNINGKIKWEYKFDSNAWNYSVGIDKSQNIYVLLNSRLVVINKNGELIWELQNNQFSGYSYNGISFSPDGTRLYTQGLNVSLISVDIHSRSIAWTFGDQKLQSGATIDNNGNIYILPNTLEGEKYIYCLSADGKLKWKFEHQLNLNNNNIEPAIDNLGNIIFGKGIIYSLNHNGELNWKINLIEFRITNSVVVDSQNNLFFGAAKDLYQLKIFSFNVNGDKNWELSVSSEFLFGIPFSINSNSEMLVPTNNSSNFLIIK